MVKLPGGASSISIFVLASLTLHAKPVPAIAARSKGSVTTDGSGAASTSVAHAGTVTATYAYEFRSVAEPLGVDMEIVTAPKAPIGVIA